MAFATRWDLSSNYHLNYKLHMRMFTPLMNIVICLSSRAFWPQTTGLSLYAKHLVIATHMYVCVHILPQFMEIEVLCTCVLLCVYVHVCIHVSMYPYRTYILYVCIYVLCLHVHVYYLGTRMVASIKFSMCKITSAKWCNYSNYIDEVHII